MLMREREKTAFARFPSCKCVVRPMKFLVEKDFFALCYGDEEHVLTTQLVQRSISLIKDLFTTMTRISRRGKRLVSMLIVGALVANEMQENRFAEATELRSSSTHW
jgi:predicted DNA-binding ribbon-helix-helix protein